ncbi:MAG: hypothetical protein JWO83_2671 [Caulobacteraceae bacterium]|nr:hypothetical protein [Caulobacteraceae bacterium]
MTYAPAERFEISRVLSRTFGVIARNFPVFAGLALILSGLPSLSLQVYQLGVLTPTGLGAIAPFGLTWIISILSSTLLQAALIHGTVSDLNGRPASLGDCLQTAIRNLLPLIGVGLATSVAMLFGFLFFIVPGLFLALSLCVSAPAQVVEGRGVFEAIGRSSDLTRNHRGAILLLFMLFAVSFVILRGLLEIVPLSLAVASIADDIRKLVVTPVFEALSALVGAAGIASIYFELRTIKEGVGVEALARAFD